MKNIVSVYAHRDAHSLGVNVAAVFSHGLALTFYCNFIRRVAGKVRENVRTDICLQPLRNKCQNFTVPDESSFRDLAHGCDVVIE